MKKTIVVVIALGVIAGLLWLAWYDFRLLARHFLTQDSAHFVKVSGLVKSAVLEEKIPVSRTRHPLETPYKFVHQKELTRGTIETDRYLLYLPVDVDWKKRFPIVFVMSPDGNAASMFHAWRNTADKFQWILVASKEHRNGIPFKQLEPMLMATLNEVISFYPVDHSRIVVAGFSGGGMAAQYLAMAHPELIDAVVVNTAMIHENFENGKGYRDSGGQLAVFLASPTDYRYDEMERNKSLLERFGWKTKWIEFPGGHTIAPDSAYQEAAAWLISQFK